MYQYKYVFAQLIAFLNRSKFNRIVSKYRGDKYVKHFTCWNQLLTLMFGQLSNRESLRDLIVAVEAHRRKCYHLGLGRHITRSNLAKANMNRDYRIFEEYAYYLIGEARRKRLTDIFRLKQHLKVKKFWGTTENAVRIQIYSAICAYCLVAIVQHDMQLNRSTYEILQILSISLTDTTHLRDIFDKTIFKKDNEPSNENEPSLFDF